VATKYPCLTADYFQQRGVPVELIVLSGSVELAPVLGLSEHIVDLVETGRTLRENGLVIIDTIAESTARLIVNRASYHLKRTAVAELIESLRAGVRSQESGVRM
jgi:ATP phosphoribosyltransferase